MADYVIGDVQGCYQPLMNLLTHIDFNEKQDRLWFVGDLVNRGPDSLAVLRFIKHLPHPARITLGNHDLHLLNALFGQYHDRKNKDDTLEDVLKASDGEELGHWLRQQHFLFHDVSLNVVMCHAGIAPSWSLAEAKQYAHELEVIIRSESFYQFLDHMYGNMPNCWSNELQGMSRLRVICNYFTRMRYCDAEACLKLEFKGPIDKAPGDIFPWFHVPNRRPIEADIVFGHWAALEGKCEQANIHAIDTGCYWGGQLTALRLQDMQRFAVPGLQKVR